MSSYRMELSPRDGGWARARKTASLAGLVLIHAVLIYALYLVDKAMY
jgi:hypothetical protein